jgi:toxin FitB
MARRAGGGDALSLERHDRRADVRYWRASQGRRKEKLAAACEGMLELFEGRILPFDTDAARRYGNLEVKAPTAGKGFPTPDGYIAAIASSRDFAVASRDASAFRVTGLTVIDPWTAGA